MAKKKSRFVIRIADAGDSQEIKPEKLRAKDLADLIVKFDNALSTLVKSQFGDDLGGISILKLSKGSITLECNGALAYEAAVAVFGKAIVEDSVPQNARNVKKIIEELEEFNLAHDSKIELKKDKKAAPFATIKKALPKVVPQESELSGETAVYGKVIGITGIEKIRVTLKLLSNDTIDFSVEPSFVKEFGRRYNDIVGVKGIATWDIASNKIVAFEMKEVLPYTEESVKEIFSSLRENFSTVFDEIADIEKFVREQRGE